MDIQVEEAQRLGMRMTITRGSMSLSKKDGGLPPDSIVQDDETILLDCERVLNKYHNKQQGAMIHCACTSPIYSKNLMSNNGTTDKHDCVCHPFGRNARRRRILFAKI